MTRKASPGDEIKKRGVRENEVEFQSPVTSWKKGWCASRDVVGLGFGGWCWGVVGGVWGFGWEGGLVS